MSLLQAILAECYVIFDDQVTMAKKKTVKKTKKSLTKTLKKVVKKTMSATKSKASKRINPYPEKPFAELFAARVKELGDWRGQTLAQMRTLIKQADPEVVEEWKWNVPVWSHDGIICTGETYKAVVKLTFAKGAALKDPSLLFNSSLDGNTRRALDIRENEKVNENAFKALIREAVQLNSKN